MIQVIIDTNIYRHNPKFDSLNFKAIEKLSEAKWLKVHVPYIVKREFQTQQREIYNKDIKSIIGGLKGLSKKQLSDKYKDILLAINNKFEVIGEEILDDAEFQFTKWIKKIDAKEHPISKTQAQQAMEAYFTGSLPLNTIKSRKDIPDSFIYQNILKIKKETKDKLHFIANDGNLHKSFNNDDQIVTYQTLSEFIESDLVQDELKDLDFLDNLEEISSALKTFENNEKEIEARIEEEIGEELIGKTLFDDGIQSDEHSAWISSYSEPRDLVIDFKDVSYYGNGHVGLTFTLNIEVYAYYYIFKSDYFAMADYDLKPVPSVTDHNDHYFEAEDDFDLCVEGVVSLSLDRDSIDTEDISSSVDLVSISVDDITSIKIC